MTQPAEVRVIREALEAVLSPSLTSAVLFEALDQAGGGIPQSTEELRVLVRGTLARVLTKRLGSEQADRVLAEIETRLGADASGMQLRPEARGDGSGSGRFPRDDESTTTIPTARDPVVVAVVAGSQSFATRLRAALGPARVAPVAVGSQSELMSLATEPALVLVDGTDFATLTPQEIAGMLGRLSRTVTRVVWASELPYGRRVIDALVAAGVPHTMVNRRDGIDPLLDLVRARKA